MTYELILTQFESLKDESKVCNFARDQPVFNRSKKFMEANGLEKK